MRASAECVGMTAGWLDAQLKERGTERLQKGSSWLLEQEYVWKLRSQSAGGWRRKRLLGVAIDGNAVAKTQIRGILANTVHVKSWVMVAVGTSASNPGDLKCLSLIMC